MAIQTKGSELLTGLRGKAIRLRIDSIRSTTKAGSGHPTSCASAAEIMSALFFSVMRYDPKNPKNPANDVFVLSKGHAAPILYAAWAEAGEFPVEELLTLREITSDLEGHPTPRLPFVDVATGSLGQGLSVGVGMGINAKFLDKSDKRIYVLLGDGESAEGSVWEAAEVASHYNLDNLCATIDINRLGQSEATMIEHDLKTYQARWNAFGWNALTVDGHNLEELLDAYEKAAQTTGRPTIVLARTIKGKGIPKVENENGHHGKPLKPEEADDAVRQLEQQLNGGQWTWKPNVPTASKKPSAKQPSGKLPAPSYTPGKDQVATRKAFGAALASLGKVNPQIVALDGDVKNSTHTEDFEQVFPGRFFQMFIAEQNMVGTAMGLAAEGKIPFASTFACFLTRAYDFIRMAAISGSNIKLVGSHVGVSIGEDGPSQMGLEDMAMVCAEPNFTVLYPCDAVSAWYATELVAQIKGPAYIRTTRPKTPVIYKPDETFTIGKCKVLRQSEKDQLTIVAAGITVFEALKAHEQLMKDGVAVRVIDLFSVQPIDRDALVSAARETNGKVITVEDHYIHGGLGDAVLAALADQKAVVYKLAIRDIPRSGSASDLAERYGVSAHHIIEKVRSILK
jgi:transketolase